VNPINIFNNIIFRRKCQDNSQEVQMNWESSTYLPAPSVAPTGHLSHTPIVSHLSSWTHTWNFAAQIVTVLQLLQFGRFQHNFLLLNRRGGLLKNDGSSLLYVLLKLLSLHFSPIKPPIFDHNIHSFDWQLSVSTVSVSENTLLFFSLCVRPLKLFAFKWIILFLVKLKSSFPALNVQNVTRFRLACEHRRISGFSILTRKKRLLAPKSS